MKKNKKKFGIEFILQSSKYLVIIQKLIGYPEKQNGKQKNLDKLLKIFQYSVFRGPRQILARTRGSEEL